MRPRLPQGFRISAQLGDALLFMPRISASRATACYHAVLSTELMPARSTMAKPEKMGVQWVSVHSWEMNDSSEQRYAWRSQTSFKRIKFHTSTHWRAPLARFRTQSIPIGLVTLVEFILYFNAISGSPRLFWLAPMRASYPA